MPLDLLAFFDRDLETYVPFTGHIAPDAVESRNGAVLTMASVLGRPHELAAASERNATARWHAALWRSMSAANLTVCIHLIRRRSDALPPPPTFRNAYSRDFDQAYREQILRGRVFRNRWFLSLVHAPRTMAGTVVRSDRWQRLSRKVEGARIDSAADLKNAADHAFMMLARALGGYGMRRLGLRRGRNGAILSEIGAALRKILYCDDLEIPIASAPLGNVLATDRVIFGPRFHRFGRRHHRIFEVERPQGPRYGAIISLKEYMIGTWPGLYDAILSLPCDLVLSQSFTNLIKPDAERKLSKQARHMSNAGDRALSQLQDIHRPGGALDQLMNGEFVMGMHSLTLAIYADTVAELHQLAALARAKLAESGAVVVQESCYGGQEAAWYSQLPVNLEWQVRPGAISSVNFAHMAEFSAFPAGDEQGRWGPAMIHFRTRGGTRYACIPHVNQDVGMMFVVGVITSGKSLFLMVWLLMLDQYMVGNDGVLFLFDKDRGNEIAVLAMGGSHIVVLHGQDSGVNPLKGLDDTPEDRAFLARWIKGLIVSDGRHGGTISPRDEARLAIGIAAVMWLPPEQRSLLALRQFLGWDEEGAGERLDRWCKGGTLGWAFDGATDGFGDAVRAGGFPIMRFDYTAILDDPEIVNPAGAYHLYRIRKYMDGRRGAVFLDEFRKYFLSAQFAEITEDFLLTARKNNWIIGLVTQQPEHVVRDTFGATLVGQCQTQVYFPNPSADEDVYRDDLHFTEGELKAYRELQPGGRQFLLRRLGENAESVIIDFDLSAMPDDIAVLSGRANTVRFAERLRAELGNNPARWLPEFKRRWRKEALD